MLRHKGWLLEAALGAFRAGCERASALTHTQTPLCAFEHVCAPLTIVFACVSPHTSTHTTTQDAHVDRRSARVHAHKHTACPPHTHNDPPKARQTRTNTCTSVGPKGGRERGSKPLSCMGSDPNFASRRAARAALATTFCFDQPRTKPTQNDRNACFICIGLHFRVFSGISIGEIAPSVAEIRCFERLSRVMHHAWHSVGLSRLMINPLA